MVKHGAACIFLPSTDFSFLFSLFPFCLPPILSTPHTPTPFFFFFFTGLYFYAHPPFREFLKLYFPHYQRGLRLKKPMVPPQCLILVFSNTSKPLPTCSCSSIQPFSHQVSAACSPLGAGGGVSQTSTQDSSLVSVPAAAPCGAEAGGAGRRRRWCREAGFSVLVSEAGRAFSTLT